MDPPDDLTNTSSDSLGLFLHSSSDSDGSDHSRGSSPGRRSWSPSSFTSPGGANPFYYPGGGPSPHPSQGGPSPHPSPGGPPPGPSTSDQEPMDSGMGEDFLRRSTDPSQPVFEIPSFTNPQMSTCW